MLSAEQIEYRKKFEYNWNNLQVTLTLLMDWDKVLVWELKHKKDIPEKGIVKWTFRWKQNFPWWKQDKGETIDEASIREFYEEVWVTIKSQKKVWVVHFELEERDWMDMHVFIATEYSWIPVESNEMKPKWIKITELDYLKFQEKDRTWLKRLLRGENIDYQFTRDKKNRLLKETISRRSELEKNYRKIEYIKMNKKYNLEVFFNISQGIPPIRDAICKNNSNVFDVFCFWKNKQTSLYFFWINWKILFQEKFIGSLREKAINFIKSNYNLKEEKLWSIENLEF